MELQVVAQGKKTSSSLSVSDQVFACEYNVSLVHQVVTAFLSGARAGTKAQKNRSAVSGGGAKPWNQKGTGRARAGTTRGPLWRTGGVTFAAKPRSYKQKVNKKMYNRAMASIVSELAREERLLAIDKIELSAPKTKELAQVLQSLEIKDVLIVVDSENTNLMLASRNMHHVAVCEVNKLDPASLITFEKMLITVDALKKLEERLA